MIAIHIQNKSAPKLDFQADLFFFFSQAFAVVDFLKSMTWLQAHRFFAKIGFRFFQWLV